MAADIIDLKTRAPRVENRPPPRIFSIVREREQCRDPQLTESLAAKLEVFASLAKNLSQEAHSLGHRTIAQTLENIEGAVETHSARLLMGQIE